ncbi:unnamed protein product [Dicrocoelium dendriticum]|nr:unnamed protein product [Dicrocoelium dendriticum]
MARGLRIVFIISVVITLLMSIVFLGVRGSSRSSTDQERTAIAFAAMTLIVLFVAAVMFIILFFACSDKYRAFMLVILILCVLAFCFLCIATACAYAPAKPAYGAWGLSGVWTCVITVVCGICLYVAED